MLFGHAVLVSMHGFGSHYLELATTGSADTRWLQPGLDHQAVHRNLGDPTSVALGR